MNEKIQWLPVLSTLKLHKKIKFFYFIFQFLLIYRKLSVKIFLIYSENLYLQV